MPIYCFSYQNKRLKQIGMDHCHEKLQPHTHRKYLHNGCGNAEKRLGLTPKKRTMVEHVRTI